VAEIECLKISSAIGDTSFWRIEHEWLKPGVRNTTADVAAKLPEYADDKHGTVTLQQFAHSIGLWLYEGMWISRAYSLDYPVELEEGMYLAAETSPGTRAWSRPCGWRRTWS
jgi:hypothetical protein